MIESEIPDPLNQHAAEAENDGFRRLQSETTVVGSGAAASAMDIQARLNDLNRRHEDERATFTAQARDTLQRRQNDLEEQRAQIDNELSALGTLLSQLSTDKSKGHAAPAVKDAPSSGGTGTSAAAQRKREGAVMYDVLRKRRSVWVRARDLSNLSKWSPKVALGHWLDQGVVETQGKGPGTQYRAK